MGRKVCQNKSQHLSKIMNNLDEMRNEGDRCDFTIKVGSVEYHAHKIILSAGSEYFKAMFRGSVEENQHGDVEMKEMDPECFKSCIDFIYTGELEIPDEKNFELLRASQILQLDNVRDAVVDELANDLHVNNFFVTKRIAKLYDFKALFLKCKEFGKNNIIDISSQPDFQNEEKADVSEILSSDDLVMSEKQKLDVAISWVGEKVEKKDDFLEILKLINLSHVPPDCLKNLYDNDPLISNDLKLYKTFNDARTEMLERSLTEHDAHESVLETSSMEMTKNTTCSEEVKKLENSDGEKLIFFNSDADCLQIVDPETNETKMLHETKFLDLIGPLDSFTAISLKSYIYILCMEKSVYRLNVKEPKPKWEKMPDTIEFHGWSPPAVSNLDSVFVIGGIGLYERPSNIVERFDPATQHWSRLRNAPLPVSNHALVSLDETIYCLGGKINNRISNAFRAFNVQSSQWTDLPSMMNAKEYCCAVAVNRRIFVFGEWRLCEWVYEWLDEVECFDIATSQWSTVTSISGTIGLRCACLVGDWIFIGRRGSSPDKIIKYDVNNNRWQEMIRFPSFKWNYFIGIQL